VKLSFAVAALATCCALPLSAQVRVRPLPAAGELIRVTPSGEPAWTGTVAALGGDSLFLRTDTDAARLVLLSAQPLDIRRSRREHWSGLGALAGAGAGLAASSLAGDRSVLSTAGGAVIGGLLGFSVAPRRWRPLRITAPARVALTPAPCSQ
jgi:hypothetical protein